MLKNLLPETILEAPENIKQHIASTDLFAGFMQLTGRVFRDVPGRKTMQITLGGRSYFIKQHFGVGWGEIAKNLISFKAPIISAMTEVEAIQKLTEIGIATTPLVAYGQRGISPASLQSFVLTEDLGDIVSLEDICADSSTYPLTEQNKQSMLITVANMATKLHTAGLVHRDFYFCHFALNRQHAVVDYEKVKQYDLYLVDLHRMLLNQAPNGNAVMKDIAGFYFSAMQNGFTADELTLFKQHYLKQSDAFWEQVDKRARQLFNKYNSAKLTKQRAQQAPFVR
jgi:heptose I phosphotransferase